MEMQELVKRAEENIRKALDDYGAHTSRKDVLEDVTDDFIRTLARDSVYAKQNLRELFSKSPVWDEKLDALVINGTRTHDPDYDRIYELARRILRPVMHTGNYTRDFQIERIITFFSCPGLSESERELCLEAMKQIAPKAYAPDKKLSRVFKSICSALGIADESAGSDFQRLYAQFADELTAKKISFKLYVSINPAHFLTMSNPKGDNRGQTLTSCHSFNSTEYDYNCGCSGYARDDVSFIVFTVADPMVPETFNNRKTTRQIFAYRPGSGLLLQSRMYNTEGGTYGAVADSKLYRDLVQREISMLEGVPNLWKTHSSFGDYSDYVEAGDGFGGYCDWTYDNFDGHISFRADCDVENVDPLEVGTYGLCVQCGCEIDHGMYCTDCENSSRYYCDRCEERCSETFTVHGRNGDELEVCERCLNDYYTYCEQCHEYYDNDLVEYVDGNYYCDDCLHEYCEECADCGEWHKRDNMTLVHDSQGREQYVCEDCLDEYFRCDECNEYFPCDETCTVYKADGSTIYVCEDCSTKYVTCPDCGELVEVREDGTCPHCGVVVEKKEDEAV